MEYAIGKRSKEGEKGEKVGRNGSMVVHELVAYNLLSNCS
jgi:hypothetical protein